MSLLSSFVLSHLIPALESAFIAHEPEMQDLLLSETQAFVVKLSNWVESKLPGDPVGFPHE
jgi:hypothetical protein